MTTVSIEDVAEILNGYAFEADSFNTESNGLPVVRIRDVVPGRSETFYSGPYPEEYLIGDGDLLVGMDGEFNLGIWQGGRALLNQRVCKVTPKGSLIDRHFLKHRLAILLKGIEANTPYVTVKHLSSEKLKREVIDLPAFAEQQRIAAILERADRLRRLRRYALELSEGYLQAVFVEMFGDSVRNPKGWDFELLDDICKLVRGSSPRPQGDPRYFGGPVPRLMIADITRDGIFVIPRVDSLTEDGAKQSRPMKAGSVVMAVSGAVGLPAVLRIDACIHDGFVGFQDLDTRYLPVYFAYLLTTLRTVSRSQAAGAIWQNLTTDQVRDWRVLSPSLELQRRFAQIVARQRRLGAQQREAERQAEQLFGALLDRAFRGEL